MGSRFRQLWPAAFQPTAQLVVENPQSDALRLSGELDGQNIRVTLHRVKPNFILQIRSLKRINESAILGTPRCPSPKLGPVRIA